jgi:transcriptional regulator with XRE-family HTH domain
LNSIIQSMMNIKVGNKLKFLRKQKGLSQEQVSEYLHISQSAYARIENGVSHSWAMYINEFCELFVIKPEDLVKLDPVAMVD